MTPEEIKEMKILEKRKVLNSEMDAVIEVIGKSGF